jgi:hypothetical protein
VALDEALRRLLEDVMSRRTPRLRHLAGSLDPSRAADAELDDVCQALTDEFVEAGFGPDGEPNDRGRLLERLIDEVARPLMWRSRKR